MPGAYLEAHHDQVVQGDSIFKYEDVPSATLIASGIVDETSDFLGMLKDFVKFDLQASVTADSVELKFLNVTRAQQDTGSLSNDGFGRVGVWPGSRSEGVYTALKRTADAVNTCLR